MSAPQDWLTAAKETYETTLQAIAKTAAQLGTRVRVDNSETYAALTVASSLAPSMAAIIAVAEEQRTANLIAWYAAAPEQDRTLHGLRDQIVQRLGLER